ncbi:MAG TPA: TolC family protein [Thermoanaerobaculaceae bacterium]|nr:TolC family protein [Thermoanaerobaculaceae bacterium]HPS76675.1 TolC family protein [Thermoanaerobaculaceae bacterium]
MKRKESSAVAVAVMIIGALAASGCVNLLPARSTNSRPVPASPGDTAGLPSPQVPVRPVPTLPEGLLKDGATFDLAQVVEIALRTSPLTRQSWLTAKAAAAQVGVEMAPFYPALDLSVASSRGKVSPDGRLVDTAGSWGPSATLSYLLLDFGGRAADVEDARQTLLAADWAHDATVQGLVFGVQQAYFQYQTSKAQLEAAQSAAKQAETALEVATGRHDAGVATIADVLQARTAFSLATFNLAGAKGRVASFRGALATAMGLPPTIPFDTGPLAGEVPLDAVTGKVEPLIEQAMSRRPDLNASRALVLRAEARVRSVRSEGLPVLSLSATANRTTYRPQVSADSRNNWSARALVTYPLFSGFKNSYGLARAKADAAAAEAGTESFEQEVVLQVWTAYYELQTAAEQVRAARDLLASAEQSERVALGRYKEGVGTILDLLTAQSALSGARAQEIQARADFFIAAAQLARATGRIAVADTAVVTEKREP